MPAYDFDVIFTLEARSNVILEVMTESFHLSQSRVFNEIAVAVAQLRRILAAKGVQYTELKRALVPSVHRTERAFVFDWSRFDAAWYGREVLHNVLPLLEKNSSRSVLLGDWASDHRFAEILHESFPAESEEVRRLGDLRSGDKLYFVYLNNLTGAMAVTLDRALTNHPAYLGSIDTTYASLLKAFLSTMLVRAFVQHKSTIIQGHEDDRNETEDVNLIGYDFEKFGYRIRSIPSWLYGWFLSYKIERPALKDDHSDTRFSLNAMTPTPQPITDCALILDEDKLAYLQREKMGSLRRADLEALSADEIAAQIRARLGGSYIYNLARAPDGETLKFNIIIENGTRARNVCAIEYRPQDRTLRVITFL